MVLWCHYTLYHSTCTMIYHSFVDPSEDSGIYCLDEILGRWYWGLNIFLCRGCIHMLKRRQSFYRVAYTWHLSGNFNHFHSNGKKHTIERDSLKARNLPPNSFIDHWNWLIIPGYKLKVCRLLNNSIKTRKKNAISSKAIGFFRHVETTNFHTQSLGIWIPSQKVVEIFRKL